MVEKVNLFVSGTSLEPGLALFLSDNQISNKRGLLLGVIVSSSIL
jgi:hypothetical protein